SQLLLRPRERERHRQVVAELDDHDLLLVAEDRALLALRDATDPVRRGRVDRADLEVHGSSLPCRLGRVRLALESDDELAAAAAPRRLHRAESTNQREDAWVLPADRRDELRDPRSSCVRGKLTRERRSDTAALVGIRERERA